MAVNYALPRNLTACEVISALVRDGFGFDRGSGSHQIYYHPDGRRVTVTFHAPRETFTTFSPKRSPVTPPARFTGRNM